MRHRQSGAPKDTPPEKPGYLDFWRVLNADPMVSDGYDTLMSSLVILSANRPLSSILVTSAQPEDGKTTTTLNLSLSMVRAGKNVLLVDADFRKPRLHRLLGLENTRGLVDVLAGTTGIQDVIRTVMVPESRSGNSRTLSVITSGKECTSVLHVLGSPKVKETIESAARLFDLTLLDAPPTLAVSDALLLAPMVSGVVLVLDTGRVTAKDAKRTKERIEESGGHILGVVMNRFDEERHGPGLHPYSDYYTS
jgi:capsular exopolysaccharide synthesis family protein